MGLGLIREIQAPTEFQAREGALLGPDIFRWGGGLPREGAAAKKFGMSLKAQGKQTFRWDILGFLAGISRGRPKNLRKKSEFDFLPLEFALPRGSANKPTQTCQPLRTSKFNLINYLAGPCEEKQQYEYPVKLVWPFCSPSSHFAYMSWILTSNPDERQKSQSRRLKVFAEMLSEL